MRKSQKDAGWERNFHSAVMSMWGESDVAASKLQKNKDGNLAGGSDWLAGWVDAKSVSWNRERNDVGLVAALRCSYMNGISNGFYFFFVWLKWVDVFFHLCSLFLSSTILFIFVSHFFLIFWLSSNYSKINFVKIKSFAFSSFVEGMVGTSHIWYCRQEIIFKDHQPLSRISIIGSAKNLGRLI